jgi:hypothetical protein
LRFDLHIVNSSRHSQVGGMRGCAFHPAFSGRLSTAFGRLTRNQA